MSIDAFLSTSTPWTCPYCTVINEESSIRCDMCLLPRPGHRKRQNKSQWQWPWAKKKSSWNCEHCSHANDPADKTCASCGEKKKGFLSSLISGFFTNKNTGPSHDIVNGSSAKPSKWMCSQCTYSNELSATECKQCSNRKIWDECTDGEESYVIISSQQDGSHDDDIITSHDSDNHSKDLVTTDHLTTATIEKECSNNDEPVSWECANCTLVNSASDSKCSACLSTMRIILPAMETENDNTLDFDPTTQWECIHCSLYNSLDNLYCRACGTISEKPAVKRQVLLPSLDPATQWRCETCSLHNNNTDLHCNACHTRRNIDITEKHDTPINPTNQWQCTHCTVYNNNDSNLCNVCSQPKDTMVTKDMSMYNSSMEGSMRKTRLYNNHTAFISISVRDKRDLIDQDAMNRYRRILEFCKRDNSTFVDPDFAPGPQSLYRNSSHPSHYWRVTQWCRPGEITTDIYSSSVKWTVYRNPEPGDIVQGALGTCWFLSALSVIAEKPELVEQIIVNKQFTEYGVYLLRLCKDGCWNVIQVDDYLPCNRNGMLVFSKGLRKQLWVPLIEKALAKLFGSYEAIESGFVLSGLSILTGYPCENIRLQNDDKKKDEMDDNLLWAKLLSFREAGFLMGASCGGRDTISHDECEAKGLQYAHAYSILDVQQVDHHRLLKLRNPHGQGTRESWNGDWSDRSSRWTDKLKQQLLPHGANQGIFWICLRDLMKYFSDIDVCHYHPSWFEERVQGELLPYVPNKMSVMAVEILETCEVDICLYQPTNRNKSDTDCLVDIVVMVMQYQAPIDDMMLENIPLPTTCVVYSDSNIKPSISLSAVLDAGFYAIVPLSFNTLSEFCIATVQSKAAATAVRPASSIPYSLALFSSKPVVTEMGKTQLGFLSHSLFLLAEKIGNKTTPYRGMWVSEVYLKNSCRIIVAENHSGWSHFMVTMECNESFNLISSRGSLFTFDCIPPKHRQIIAVLTQLERGGYMFSARLQFDSSMANPLGKWGASHTPEIHSGISQLHNPQPINGHR